MTEAPQKLVAAALLADFIERRRSGGAPTWEEFLAEHPHHASELEALQRSWEAVGGLLEVLGTEGVSHVLTDGGGVELPTRVAGGSPESDGAADPVRPDSSDKIRARIRTLLARERTDRRYVIQREVGRGGMGSILGVYDTDLQRVLAMKVMLEDGAERESDTPDAPDVSLKLARFLEEAQVTGQLDHPGVVPVHEMGIDAKGRMYFTMQLVRGRELREVFERVHAGDEEWTLPRALGVFLKVCETMAYAHDKGVVHRDLKPSNIMVGKYGQVYVMDWGLALAKGKEDIHDVRPDNSTMVSLSAVRTDRNDARGSSLSSPLFTMDGTIIGTPYYMPPEQAMGRLEEIDCSSDVYAVGAMLYHLLTGVVPYHAEGRKQGAADVLMKVIQGPPKPLHELAPHVPGELEAICEKAMQRDPKDRYASMGELAKDLQAFLEGRVVSAHRTGPYTEIKKWILRNRALAGVAAAAVLLAFAGLGSTAYVQARGRRIADANAELARQASEETRAALEVANAKSYAANVTAAAVNLRVGNLEEAGRRLADCVPELRGWEWRHFDLRRDPSLRSLDGMEDTIDFLAVSADGRRVAAAAWNALRVWDVSTGREVAVLEGHEDRVLSAVFAPDGSRLASDSWDGTVRIWDLEAVGEPVAVLNVSDPSVSTLVFGPGAELVASGSGNNSIHVWNARTGVPLAILRGGEEVGAIQSLAFSPDGTLLAAGSGEPDDAIRVWSIAEQRILVTLRGHERAITDLDFAPDGRRLASGSVDNGVRVFDVETGAQELVLAGHADSIHSVAFSPDGSKLASASKDGSVRLWDARTGRALHVLEGHGSWVASARFVGGGWLLVSQAVDGSVLLWDVERGELLSVLRAGDPDVTSVATSPDGTFVVSGYRDGRVRVWCSATEGGFAALPCPSEVAAAVFAPDGSRIVAGLHDGSVRLFDAASGEPLAVLRGHADRVRSVATGPRGRWIVSGSDDRTVRVWDAEGRGEAAVLAGHEDWVACVAVAPDGARIASGDESAEPVLRTWSLPDGAPLASAAGHADSIACVAFTPDGGRIVTGSADATLRVWDAADLAPLGVLEGHTGAVRCVAVGADGELLVSGADDLELRLWSLSSGEELATLRGHEAEVLAVAFGPAGDRIFSAGADGNIRVWDLHTRSALAVLSGHEGEVSSLAVDVAGGRILSGSFDGTLRIWETEPAAAHTLWRGVTRTRVASSLVDRLLAEEGDPERVAKRLAGLSGLEPDLREAALRLIEVPGR